jgi:hypothetical protein
MAFIVGLLHSTIMGLPAYFLVKRRGLINWWISLICGFVVGCLPMALITLPLSSPGVGFIADGVPMVVNGVATTAGWLSYLGGVLGAGCLGMAGGLAAWVVWWMTGKNPIENSNEPLLREA